MSGKTILITGASRGIGYAAAQYLLTRTPPNNVVLVARTKEPLLELQKQYPDHVQVVAGDVTDYSLAEESVRVAVEKYKHLDGVILNHGILGQVAKVEKADLQQWTYGFNVNFFTLVAFVKAALPALREKEGKIIFTSSGAATGPTKGWGLYGATKAAMNSLAMTIGVEEDKVTAIAIRPGMVDTEMQRQIREDHRENLDQDTYARFSDAHKEGKLVKPEAPAQVMAELALRADRSLSGKFITWNAKELESYRQ